MDSTIKTANMTRLLTGAAALIMLAGCATTPEPVQQTVSQPVAEVPVAQPIAPPSVVSDVPPAQTYYPEAQANLPIPGTAEDFAYQSGGDARIYFAYNQYDLSASALNVLRNQANWLNTYTDVTAVIEGNADERGTREYNLALGARRANSVKDFLVGQGVSTSRLTAISFGKERPIDGRSNEDGWARNRNSHTNISVVTISN